MAMPTGVVFDLNPADLTLTPLAPIIEASMGGLTMFGGTGFGNRCTNPGPAIATGWSLNITARTNYVKTPRPFDDTTFTGWTGVAGAGGAGTFAVRVADGDRPYRAFRHTWTTQSTTPTGGGGVTTSTVDVVGSTTMSFAAVVEVGGGYSQRLQMSLIWKDSGGSPTAGPVSVSTIVFGKAAILRLEGVAVPATAVTAVLQVLRSNLSSSYPWYVGTWLEVSLAWAVQAATSAHFIDGEELGCVWEGTAGASRSTFAPPTDVTLSLDATTSRRAGKQSRKIVRGATGPSEVVAVIDGVGGLGTYSALGLRPRFVVYAYTTHAGITVRVDGVDPFASATVPLVAGSWTKIEQTYDQSVTTLSPVVTILASEATSGDEIVWLCDAMVARADLMDFVDGDTPGYAWTGTAGESTSEGIVTWRELAGHAELLFGGGAMLSGQYVVTPPAEITTAVVIVPEPIGGPLQAGSPYELGYAYGEGLRFVIDHPSAGPTDRLAAGFATGGNSDALDFEPGVPVVLIGTGATGAQHTWVDGVLTQSATFSYSPGSSTYPQVQLTGSLRRMISWDRVLTDMEVATLTQELALLHTLAPVQVAWAAPAHTGGLPIIGYRVRCYDGMTLVEKTVGDILTTEIQAPRSGDVQVQALNEAGAGRPAEGTY